MSRPWRKTRKYVELTNNYIKCPEYFIKEMFFFKAAVISGEITAADAVGAASQRWSNERMMVYIKLMMVNTR